MSDVTDLSEDEVRARARELAAGHVGAAEPLAWFEQIYREAEQGNALVPWADLAPNPNLVAWATAPGTGRTALVVGCGLGDDAEFLAGLGYQVTAFDISPTAIEAARKRFPSSPVRYLAADLLATPAEWAGAFDLVVEIYTIQPLYGEVRAKAIAAIPGLVAPGGTLLVVARATEEPDPVRDPSRMPWALTRAEIAALAGDALEPVTTDLFMDDETPPKLRWRVEYRRH